MKLTRVLFRQFRKRPLLSSLNVVGLSIGLAASLVISLYLFQENTYELGFEDSENTFRIETHFLGMGRLAWGNSNLQHVLNEVPELEEYTVFRQAGGRQIEIDNKSFVSLKTLKGDSAFFKVFDFEFLAGAPEEALRRPGDVVLTEELAMKLFGRTDVLGELISVKDDRDFLVSGVVKTPLFKSHLEFELISYNSDKTVYDPNKWFSIGGYIYAKSQASEQKINRRLDSVAIKYAYPIIHANGQVSPEEWLNSGNKIQFFARPIRDIYLEPAIRFELGPTGDKQIRMTLTIVAIFIMTIAAINFMNLTTARASLRTKEIGVRKVLGVRRKQLISQFLGESLMITLLSALLACGLCELFIYLINQSLGEVVSISFLNYPDLLVYLFLGVVFLGVVSGLYPAFYLSSVKMVPLLKGMKLTSVLNMNFAKTLRNVLVVFQFAISSTLIIGVLFVYSQLNFLRNMELGFEKDQILVVKGADVLKESQEAFLNELKRLPGVEEGSYTFRMPADGASSVTSTMLDPETTIAFETFQTDPYFHEVLDLDLLEGEWFDPKKEAHDSLVVLNRAAILAIGMEEPIGKVIGNYWRIIGVVDDFYYGDLKQAISPAIFKYSPQFHQNLAVRFNSENVDAEAIQEVWKEFTNEPFNYYHLNQNFEAQLDKEKTDANAVMVFTALAIFISCLGLFGLAAFIADQRLHEFGIRKVLGAGVVDIVRIFSFDFVKLVFLAFLIAVPIAYYGVDLWLEGYSNRISIGVSPILMAGFLSVLVAFSTVLFQSLKTGKLNPVDTIKNE